MTKTEARHAAQDKLMDALRREISQLSQEAQNDTVDAALVQFRRIEKLFGYEPGSYSPYV